MNSGQVFTMHKVMQRHEDPLDLQSLPPLSPPQDGWPAIESALRHEQRQRRIRRYAVGPLAAAATIALALGLVSYFSALGLNTPDSNDTAPRTAQMVGHPAPDSRGIASADGSDRVDSLVSLSLLLEQRLRILRSNVGDLPTGAAVYQVELEDLVAQVDEELSGQPRSAPLWNQRVSLLLDLEQLYENQLRREYRQVASL